MTQSLHDSQITPALQFRSVTKLHPAPGAPVTALREVSFSVTPGEFVAIMGPSGSGKSTLLNLAGGLDAPNSGEVIVGDARLSQITKQDAAALRRRDIGYVFQNFNLIPILNTIENVTLPLELDGLKAGEAAEIAYEALKAVHLEKLAYRFPADLSGGQAQRVAIARAIVGPRQILLADEPTGALDSHTSEAVIALLRERAENGTAVLLVTHDARLAAWADRIIYLKDGEIVDDADARMPLPPNAPTNSLADLENEV